jgi:hypothetical protein
MKIARILHESCPFPVVALERDGALYDVAELDARFATPRARRLLGGASDFFSRVIALGGVGLDELDQRLAAGYRPTEARLAPGSFLWLPPCDTDRAMLVHVTRDPAGELTARLGNARAILGHEAASPFPGGATQPELELGIAAILGDDLRRASVAEAQRAILGAAIVNDWAARDLEARGLGPLQCRDFATQLGPVLVTSNELEGAATLRTQIRVGGAVLASGALPSPLVELAEAVACASEHVELHAGDIVTLAAPLTRREPVDYGAPVDLLIERLGKLVGSAVRGPPTKTSPRTPAR